MTSNELADELYSHLVDEAPSIRAPWDWAKTIIEFDGTQAENVEDVADVLARLLLRGCSHEQLTDVGDDILTAFHDFWVASAKTDRVRMKRSVARLATKIEPFCKTLAYLLWPQEFGGKPKFNKLLGKLLSSSWKDDKDNDLDRLIRFARGLRHSEAHSAPSVRTVDLFRNLEATLGVYMLIVAENYDRLAEAVRSEVERALRQETALDRYLRRPITQPRGTEHYVPCRGRYQGTDEESASLEDSLYSLIVDDSVRVILLIGEAGIGKTTFLQRLVVTLAEQEMERLATTGRIRTWPIYYPLSSLQCRERTRIDQVIFRRINQLGGFGLPPGTPSDEVFETADPLWLICLDGLDELKDWNVGINLIEDFIETYPQVKIVLASRPEKLSEVWHEDYHPLTIEDWNDSQVKQYVRDRMYEDSELAEDFLVWLQRSNLFNFVRIPILLKEVVDFWLSLREDLEDSDADPLTVIPPVRAVDRAVKGLLSHQLSKLSGDNRHRRVDSLYKSLRKLAFKVEGHDTCEADGARMEIGDDLDDLVQMSLVVHRHQEVGFAYESVKLCFAAKEFGYKLSQAVEDSCLPAFIRSLHGKRQFWKQCLALAPLVLPSDARFPTHLLDWVAFTLNIQQW